MPDLFRVNELQGAGGGIARICERRVLVPLPFFIQPVEGSVRHVYLAADLKLAGYTCPGKLLRDVPYMPDILCNIVSYSSVPTCQRPVK